MDELAVHGVTVEQALQIPDNAPVMVRQPSTYESDDPGTPRRRPARIRLIGPDNGGRMLALVVEYPDPWEFSKIVTGWPADKEELALYRQRIRKRR